MYYLNLSGDRKCVELRKSKGIHRFHDDAFDVHFAERHEISMMNSKNALRNSSADISQSVNIENIMNDKVSDE